LAASTVSGWFKTWSVVPAWEKFDVLIKALGAEHDEDWRSLHRAALTADRQRKQEERQRRKLGGIATQGLLKITTTEGKPHPQPQGNHTATMALDAPVADESSDVPSLAPTTGAPVALRGWATYSGPDLHPAPPEPAPVAVPRQLPVKAAHFTGRSIELVKLDALLAQDDTAQPAATAICAIAGTAGVGKTALVVHWAHQVRDQFPDGQLFVNLRGYDPGPAVTPEQALEEFLRALHVAAEWIPAGLEARAALYRSLLHGRRMLIVLDNANSAKQVRPLLPSSPTCRTVITSRSRLSALIAHDGASRILVDLLPPPEALALLRNILGETRVAAEPEAAATLARWCAYLPLALRIVAERAVTHPYVTLADLARELAVERDRLDLLSADEEEDENTAVRAVFSWSYNALPPEAARAFRLLGLHASPDISTPAAAALTDTTPIQARRLLETLGGMHLVEEIAKDRYRFHDLLRVYAAECAEEQETDQDRRTAIRRVLTWYLHTGDAADRILNPHRHRIPLEHLENVSSLPLEFTSYRQALDWCETERANLVAATRQAAVTGEHVIAWKLPLLAMLGFFSLRKHWEDWITTYQIGLDSARRLHDRKGEAWILGALGFGYFDLQQHEKALDCFQNALSICEEIDDPWGKAVALTGLSRAYFHLGNYEESLSGSKCALRISQEIDDPWSQTLALISIGGAYRKLQNFEEALRCFHQALTVLRPAHDQLGEAMALQSLGATYRNLQQFDDALTHFQQACTIYCQIGDRLGEANTLRSIGDTLQNLNRMDAAAEYWRKALTLFEDLGDSATAARVRTSLGTCS
jgi:tetratricopeptide (TPR) repeat protein